MIYKVQSVQSVQQIDMKNKKIKKKIKIRSSSPRKPQRQIR